MIDKKDVLGTLGNYIHVKHEVFLESFTDYDVRVNEGRFHPFELTKQVNQQVYMCFMRAEEIINLKGAEYFTRLINNIQADAV